MDIEYKFVIELSALCDKYENVQFYYTTNDDGIVIEVGGKKVATQIWGSDELRKVANYYLEKPNTTELEQDSVDK